MKYRLLACLFGATCIMGATYLAFQKEPAQPTAKDELSSPPSNIIAKIDYRRDILPILSGKCFTCHGPDQHARKGGLRLDRRELALKPAKSGDVPIQPGNSAHSELVRRICAEDETERMPPVKGGKALTAQEKELIKRWIDEGAEFKLHWALVKPQRAVPPRVKNETWIKNDIDRFILHRLEEAGLAPSPAADRETLIRRLSFDLRGLPPSLAEVDEFLADASPDAYEKLVDRMLASPHFGERMAQTWLDLARFGDTSGYHFDSTRQMWLWRDWVINAFNSNMPFDQFTIEQLAGDLLPGATVEQKIASGFNRNTRFNEEGGVDPEEYVIRYNVDRTNNVGQVWLGMTLHCAECHDHKYDPITQKEYYQLYAYFTGITEPMTSGNHDMPLLPILKLPSPQQVKALDGYRAELAITEKAIAKELHRFPYIDPLAKTMPGAVSPEVAGANYHESQIAWEIKDKGNAKLPPDVQAALKVERGTRTEAQRDVLRSFYLRKIHEVSCEIIAPLEEDVEQLTKKIKNAEDAVPYTLVTEEMASPREAYVLIRGDFLNKGERVERDVPASMPALAPDAPKNRLGLARWLISAEHPLTARVQANRLWAHLFGDGIVRTAGDFGSQGEFPSHPELLDWLAAEYVTPQRGSDRGWDNKALLRTISLSATYRQSSNFSEQATKIDPANRLLSRAPRRPLGAEEIRDNALAVAGLLNRKIGGPSFMPYQPVDFYKGKNENWVWKASQGDEQYRRGIYAFWRRNSLHPMFAILDAPTREECTVHRTHTNTPLQALVTLNDPSLLEAAYVFAERLLTRGPGEINARLRFAFRSVTGRLPTDRELELVRNRFQQQQDRFRLDPAAATNFINAGQYPRDAALDAVELASWTALVNMLLNLDEVLTRG